jgi:hypothetical protein
MPGQPKPLLYDKVKDTERFVQYKPKIIHLTATSDEMWSLVPKNWKFAASDFRLEDAMRIMMMRKFLEVSSTHPQYVLFRSVMSSLLPFLQGPPEQQRRNREMYFSDKTRILEGGPLAIQSDGDEIMTSRASLHLKHCALRRDTFPIYAPCYSYKHNVHTLQSERFLHLITDEDYDMANPSPKQEKLTAASTVDNKDSSIADTKDYLHYLNNIAPMVDMLYSFVSANSTLRIQRMQLDVHLGIGAALHLSSVAEPGEVWCKAGSTHHGLENRDMNKVMSKWFIEKGKRREINVDDIYRVTNIQTYPSSKSKITYGSHSEGSEKRNANVYCFPKTNWSLVKADGSSRLSYVGQNMEQKLRADLPYALRHYPERYPFIIPPFCDS